MTAGWMLLAFVAGMVAVHFLIHRPDRANRAIEHAAEVDGLVDELERAEDGRKSAEQDAATYLGKIGELATEKAHLRIALDNERAEHRLHQRACASHCEAIERREWLPTIEGVGLDLIDTLPVGWRLDWDAFDDGTPIGASVVESLAEVVPIRGLS